ncbi:hypothetical protein AWB79_06704 [Caballeronia hypogeia]|uniref:Uncharacterized protein n=1 Tax=Caballeronia hypogeia TaxID=1777140 RepID=A0A158DAU9_9BURK|nr:hypothetical protein [Caballeronia hypogeia]SAK91490.1 hypothetical protein AWB79_06704 [Caballeronia hypogeia]
MIVEDEVQKLRQADTDIEMANRRIERQKELILELKRDGHDVRLAVELLVTMQGTLGALVEHRRVLLENVERTIGARSNKEGRPDRK